MVTPITSGDFYDNSDVSATPMIPLTGGVIPMIPLIGRDEFVWLIRSQPTQGHLTLVSDDFVWLILSQPTQVHSNPCEFLMIVVIR